MLVEMILCGKIRAKKMSFAWNEDGNVGKGQVQSINP